MTPASAIARMLAAEGVRDRPTRSSTAYRHRRARARAARRRDALAAAAVVTAPAEARPRPRGPVRRIVTARATAWVLAVTVAASTGAFALARVQQSNERVRELRAQIASTQQELTTVTAGSARADALRAQVAVLQRRLEALQDKKVRTVYETKTVTKTVPRWVPDGDGVEVETTGFEDQIEIHDVQLTHAYGYSDLIGIAVNRSGRTISYAELGCTFLGADGELLANEIVNRQSWAPGQSWGFDCAGQVDATGGILRVDEMS